jgi:hypothetical protein
MASIIDKDRFRDREVEDGRADIRAIKAELPHLATKEALRAVEGSLMAHILALRADLHARDTRNLVWLIGTVIAVASLAFSIARFVGIETPTT